MASRFRSPAEQEVQDYLDQVAAGQAGQSPRDQTLARSRDPRLQRIGQRNMADRAADNLANADDAARQQEKARKDQEDQAIKAAKEAEQAAEAQRAQSVRQGAANGQKTTTDIETGKRVIATHPDGSPVYNVGAVSKPFLAEQPDAAAAPASMLGQADGSLGATGGTTTAVPAQTFRNDRGKTKTVPLETKTDPKTGAITYTGKDSFGAPMQTQIGIDPQIAQKQQRLGRLEQEKAQNDLRRIQLGQARTVFEPRWQPTKAGYLAAKSKFEGLANNYVREPNPKPGQPARWGTIGGNGMWQPILAPERNDKFQAWQKDMADAKANLDRATKAYQPAAQYHENLTKQERAARLQWLENRAEKIRIENNLPDDDGGISMHLAQQEDPSIGNPYEDAVSEVSGSDGSAQPSADPVTGIPATEPQATEPTGQGAPAPQTPAVQDAFKSLQGLQGVTVEPLKGFTALNRNGRWIASLETNDIGESIVTLKDEARSQEDISQIVRDTDRGIPIYLRDNRDRPKASEEAAKVAMAFRTLNDPALAGDGQRIARTLASQGLDPVSIRRAVDNGEMSVQSGKVLLKNIWGDSLEVPKFDDPANFQAWLDRKTKDADTALQGLYDNPALKDQNAPGRVYQKAASKDGIPGITSGFSLDQQKAVKMDYAKDWAMQNAGKPGVSRADIKANYEKAVANNSGKVTSGANALRDLLVNDVIGSMVGLSAGVVGDLSSAEVAMLGNTDAKKALEESMRLRNRDWANWKNAAGRNIKAWTTPEGRATAQTLNTSLDRLQRTLDEEADQPYPDKARIDAAELAVRDAALAMHNLNPDTAWPVTSENLDPSKDSALGTALADYQATADPRSFALYRERLLMNNTRRQISAEMQQRNAPYGGGFLGSVAQALNVGWQEIGSELIADAAALVTAGGSKAIQAGLKATGAVGKAARVESAANRISRGLEAAWNAGIKRGTLQKPLTVLDKARNVGVRAVQGAVGEGTEELAVSPGSDSPTPLQDFAVGMLGAVTLAPAQMVAESIRTGAGTAPTPITPQIARANETFATRYNAENAKTAGFEPVTPEQVQAARGFINTGEREQAIQGIAQAVNDHGQIQGGDEASTSQRAQLRQQVAQTTAQLVVRQDDAIQAAQAVAAVPEPAKRTFYTGIAKVAAGNADQLTANEMKAIQGARTEAGADYFEQIPQPDGTFREQLTTEAVDELRTTMPAVARLAGTSTPTPTVQSNVTTPQTQVAPAQAQVQPAAALPQEPGATGMGTEVQGSGGAAPSGAGEPGPVTIGAQPPAQAPEIQQPQGIDEPTSAPMQQPDGVGTTDTAADPFEPTADDAASLERRVQAEAVADEVVSRVEKSIPGIKGRIQIAEERGAIESGGAYAENGRIVLPLPDIEAELDRNGGDINALADTLERYVSAHEVVHMIQFATVEAIWRDKGKPGSYGQFFNDWYGRMHAELGDGVMNAAAKIYGQDSWNRITPAAKAAEVVRMLVESRINPDAADVSELFREVRQAKSPTLIETIKRAIELLKDLLTKGELPQDVQDHVAQIEALYRDLTQESPAQAAEPTGTATEGTASAEGNGGGAPAAINQSQPANEAAGWQVRNENLGESYKAAKRQADEIESRIEAQRRKDSVTLPPGFNTYPDATAEGMVVLEDSEGNDIRYPVTMEEAAREAWGISGGNQFAETQKLEKRLSKPLQQARDAMAKAGQAWDNNGQNPKAAEIQAEADAAKAAEEKQRQATAKAKKTREANKQAEKESEADTTKPKRTRQIDSPARREAFAVINSGEHKTISKLYGEVGKITPLPPNIALIKAKRDAKKKLTESERKTFENFDAQYNGIVFKSHFPDTKNGKIAREVLGLIMARQGEGLEPSVAAQGVNSAWTPNELWQSIRTELGRIAKGKATGNPMDIENPTAEDIARAEAQNREAMDQADIEQQQAENFEAANTADNGGKPISVEDFTLDMVGKTVTVDGEAMRVADVEWNSFLEQAQSVTLEDGTRFGRQTLEDGEVVYVEVEKSTAVENASTNQDAKEHVTAESLRKLYTRHGADILARYEKLVAEHGEATVVKTAQRLGREYERNGGKGTIPIISDLESNQHLMRDYPAEAAQPMTQADAAKTITKDQASDILKESEALKGRPVRTYEQAVAANQIHMGTRIPEWSAFPFSGELVEGSPVQDTTGISELSHAPTLFPSGTVPGQGNCEWCGHQPIKGGYHIKHDGKKWTMVVGSECIMHFAGISGNQMAADAKESAAIEMLKAVGDARKQLVNEFQYTSQGGYGKTTYHWRTREAEDIARKLFNLRGKIREDSGKSALSRWMNAQKAGITATLAEYSELMANPETLSMRIEWRERALKDAERRSTAQYDPEFKRKDAAKYAERLRGELAELKGETAEAKTEPQQPAKPAPASAMDRKNADSKELFANDGGFQLSQQTTQDGDKITAERKAKEEAQAAQDKQQQRLFDVPEPTAGKIEDFGEKMKGARKDKQPSISRDISDDDLASQPLSQIWPKSEVDAIEDIDIASIAHAAREEVPAKPRVGYKIRRWVEQVKTVRELMRLTEEFGADETLKRMDRPGSALSNLADKIRLLREVPREHWGRIERVSNNPHAYTYKRMQDGSLGEKIPAPFADARIDGKTISGKNVEELTAKVRAYFGEKPAATTAMKFEVRGNDAKGYNINKKGDPLYRSLKHFDTAKEALAFVRENQSELVKEWEKLKERENVKERDLRTSENRPRVGSDHRKGKDATPEMFMEAFGFRGVEFGNWVTQGANAKERQGMLNQAYDALLDLASIVGVPSKALSLNGTMGLAFGSRGHGWASAHYEPGNIVINLTKTRGAGTLAHEWFHALDNYFSRIRGGEKTMAQVGSQQAYRANNYITTKPEPMMIPRFQGGRPMTKKRLADMREKYPDSPYYAAKNWMEDPKHPEGVRKEVETAFADLVNVLADSPMAKRAAKIDKGKSDGYWSQTIEIAARSFENYVIAKMLTDGYQNDYLANVVGIESFGRDRGLYPYHLAEELPPIKEAFDNLFSTIQTKETDKGTALFSSPTQQAPAFYSQLARVIEQKMPKTAPPAQVVQIAASGAKAEEVKWSGLIPWLQGREKVSKDEVLEFLRNEGAVRFEEVTLGGRPQRMVRDMSVSEWAQQAMPEQYAKWEQATDPEDKAFLTQLLRREYQWRADAEAPARLTGDPKFSQYTLPGGENYREVVLAMPNGGFEEWLGKRGVTDFSKLEAGKQKALVDEFSKQKGLGYTSSHFPDVPNYVAHMRLTDRVIYDHAKPNGGIELGKDFFTGKMKSLLPLEIMERSVVRLVQNNEIQKAVIASIPVDVVNILRTKKFAPKDLFRYNAMGSILDTFGERVGLRIAEGIVDALGATHALLRAKILDSLAAGLDKDIFTTIKTSDFDSRDIRDILSTSGQGFPSSLLNPQTGGTTTRATGSVLPRSSNKPNSANRAYLLNRFFAAISGTPTRIRGPIGTDEVISPARLTQLLNVHAEIKSQKERLVKDGKPGLFVEEFQSDRHQAGREKGYAPMAGDIKAMGINLLVEGGMSRADAEQMMNTPTGQEMARKKFGEVPDAPFRTTWPLALFKRALRDAVASGKEWIGWTTGSTQADRFDLSKQIDRIAYDDAKGQLMAWRKGTQEMSLPDIRETVPMEKVGDYIGKEAAQKLAEAKPKNGVRSLVGMELKIGGEGMRGFYDNMLPKEIGKYVKQWGARVMKSEITTTEGGGRSVNQILREDFGYRNLLQEEVPPAAREQARKIAEDERKNGRTTPIWRIDITDAMRKGVQTQGQALFSSPTRRDTGTPDLFAAASAPDAKAKLGDVKVGRVHALNAYRALTAKKAKVGLSAAEEQQLLDVEQALGQKLAFDMEGVKGEAPATVKDSLQVQPAPKAIRGSIGGQQDLMMGGETLKGGQMTLFSSQSPNPEFVRLRKVLGETLTKKPTEHVYENTVETRPEIQKFLEAYQLDAVTPTDMELDAADIERVSGAQIVFIRPRTSNSFESANSLTIPRIIAINANSEAASVGYMIAHEMAHVAQKASNAPTGPILAKMQELISQDELKALRQFLVSKGYDPIPQLITAEIHAHLVGDAVTNSNTLALPMLLRSSEVKSALVEYFDSLPRLEPDAQPGQYFSEPGMLFSSVTPEQDREYLAAVESGDMETAQRMVDEAAKAAGYDIGPLFHGSPYKEITRFKRGFWTSDPDRAAGYLSLSGQGKVYRAYLKITRPYKVHSENTWLFHKIGYEGKKGDFHDGAITDGTYDAPTVAVVVDPSQIKSADPVTYDSNGNVIPLSQRFNPASESILYSSPSGGKRVDPLLAAIKKLITEPEKKAETFARMNNLVNGIRRRFDNARLKKEFSKQGVDAARYTQIRDVAILEAVAKSLPPEIRGKLIGSFRRLDELKTERGREKYLLKMLPKIEAALETHLQKLYRKDIRKVLDKSKPRPNESRNLRGRIGAVGHAIAKQATDAMTMEPDEALAAAAALRDKIEQADDMDFDTFEEMEGKAMAMELFGDYENADSARLEKALEFLKNVYAESRDQWLEVLKERKAKKESDIDALCEAIKAPEFVSNEMLAAAKKKSDKITHKFADSMLEWISSYEQILGRLKENTSDPKAIAWVDEQTAKLRDARGQYDDRLESERVALETAMEDIFNTRKGWIGKFQLDPILHELSTRRDDHGITVLEGVKNEPIIVPKHIAESLIRREVSAYDYNGKRYEITSQDMPALTEAWERFEELPDEVQAKKRVITFTRQISAGRRNKLGAYSQLELLKEWLAMRQTDLAKKYASRGWDETTMEELERALKPEVKRLGLWMVDRLESQRAELDAKHREEYGIGMDMVDNYFPALFEAAQNQESTLSTDGTDTNVRAKTASGLKSRVAHNARPRQMNALSVFLSNRAQIHYFMTHATPLREMLGTFRSTKSNESMRVVFGDNYVRNLGRELKLIETNGMLQADGVLEAEKFMRKVQSGYALGILGLKLSTLAINTTAVLNAALGVPAAKLVKGFTPEYIGDVRRFFDTPAIRRRLKHGTSHEVRVAAQGGIGNHPLAAGSRRLAQTSLEAINWWDTFSNGILGAAAYRAALEEARAAGLSEEQATRRAEQEIDRLSATVMQPNNLLSRSIGEAQFSQHPIGGLMFMFATEPRKNIAIGIYAMRKLLTGKGPMSAGMAAQQVMTLVLFYSALGYMIRSAYQAAFNAGDDEPEELMKRLHTRMTDAKGWTNSLMTEHLKGIPLIGEAMGRFITGAVNEAEFIKGERIKQFDASPNPLNRAVRSAFNAAAIADDKLSPEQKAEQVISAIQGSIGMLPETAVLSQAGNVAKDALGLLTSNGMELSQAEKIRRMKKRFTKFKSELPSAKTDDGRQDPEIQMQRDQQQVEYLQGVMNSLMPEDRKALFEALASKNLINEDVKAAISE